MIYIEKTRMAMMICFQAHSWQKDKAGFPYAAHPLWVADVMQTEDECCIALLHDVCEDSDMYSLDNLRDLFGDTVADALDAITRRDDESYFEYIFRLKHNEIARTVKIADLIHNSDRQSAYGGHQPFIDSKISEGTS